VLVRICSNQKCRQVEFKQLETLAAAISEDDREVISDTEPIGAIGKIKGTSPDDLIGAIRDDLLTLVDRACGLDTSKVEDSARRLLDYLGYIAAKLAISGKEEELTRIRKLITDVLMSGQVSTGKELTAHQRVAMRLEATCSAIGRMRSAAEQRRRRAEEMFNGDGRGMWDSYARAFSIFAKYPGDGSGYTHAAHGKLWAGPNPESVMIEDLEQLNSLGWLPDYQTHCFYRLV